ncbi:PREDICTED: protein MIZU-KUSSEI 1-like [Nelumbo nucifera]|uniref:Protein MIZU-KUSSEI 1-like n=2 Tax=Nelumbo nucifera TaxID=4432 RepID=A0A1U7ZD54_NELNU|nr:PREDICTED: protein MIZU-KUSSEI 1-like [Nelumbo nucifera]DAD39936.1 TPA_asm: hypothetical protein HUJ06_014259 [Nelumbo nucifera]
MAWIPQAEEQHSSQPLREETSTVTPESEMQLVVHPHVSLEEPKPQKKPSKSIKLFRRFRLVFRAFPVITPGCKMPIHPRKSHEDHIRGGIRMTGTLFGYRKARANLAIQESSRCLPMLVLELAIPTAKLLQEMGTGLARIALECEKHAAEKAKRLIDEPVWIMFWNGRKVGYSVRRDPTENDLNVMQLLHAVSIGAGVLPTDTAGSPDGELAYTRTHIERVVVSKDSETFYMMNPDGKSGPELSIFLIRI